MSDTGVSGVNRYVPKTQSLPNSHNAFSSLKLILFFFVVVFLTQGWKFHSVTPTSVCVVVKLDTNLDDMNNKVWIMGSSV